MIRTLSKAVSWPAMILHELTHMALALPWADESAIIVDETGPAHHVNWADDTPLWAVALTSLGPTLLGSLVGLVGLWRLLTAPPASASDMLVAAAIAGYWVIYVAPSPADLDIQAPEQRNGGSQ